LQTGIFYIITTLVLLEVMIVDSKQSGVLTVESMFFISYIRFWFPPHVCT